MRALESDLDPGTSHPDKESELIEEVYLYRITGGKLSNATVTLQVNTIPVTLHPETQADVTVITEKHVLKEQVAYSRRKQSLGAIQELDRDLRCS